MATKQVKRGELWIADLNSTNGSEQGGIRPVLIIQNDLGNYYSPTTIIAPLTTRLGKNKIPTHVEIHGWEQAGLSAKSMVLMEQIRTIDKLRLKTKIGEVDNTTLTKVNLSLIVSLSLQVA